MRAIHLIESAHDGHSTTGRHTFLSVAAHGALVLAAVYATTQSSSARVEPEPDPHVYFVPEPRPVIETPSPAVSRPRPVQRATTPAPVVEPKTAALTAQTPSVIPAADVPLADPSASAPATPEPAATAAAGDGTAGPVGNAPFDVNHVEVPAAALSGAGPEYPDRAMRLGLSGRVSARFIVGKNGRVESDVVILSASSGDFAAEVRDYLRRARYSPARVAGQPVRQLVEQEFVFQLRQ